MYRKFSRLYFRFILVAKVKYQQKTSLDFHIFKKTIFYILDFGDEDEFIFLRISAAVLVDTEAKGSLNSIPSFGSKKN